MSIHFFKKNNEKVKTGRDKKQTKPNDLNYGPVFIESI